MVRGDNDEHLPPRSNLLDKKYKGTRKYTKRKDRSYRKSFHWYKNLRDMLYKRSDDFDRYKSLVDNQDRMYRRWYHNMCQFHRTSLRHTHL